MIEMIAQGAVVGVVVAGMCGMVWYIATWEAKAYVAAPPRPPRVPTRFDKFFEDFWGWVGICLLIAGLGLLMLAAVVVLVITLFGGIEVTPMAIVIGLLVYIAIKLDTRK